MAGFHHEASLYRGTEGFLARIVPFVLEGVDAGEPVLVLVPEPRLGAVREALADAGCAAGAVSLINMGRVGRNPARIIPVWLDFLENNGAGDRPVRGVGEPIWPGRSPDELIECQRHEVLLNVALAGAGPVRILCPYDEETLEPAVIAEARHSHPWVSGDDSYSCNHEYRSFGSQYAPFDAPLAPAPAGAAKARFDATSLRAVRRAVHSFATSAGLSDDRAHDLVLATNEVATNSIRHGGGSGTLHLWQDGDDVVCEVTDAGRITEPMAGRLRPPVDRPGGRGLWLVNQLCDLVQIRAHEGGSVVRLRQHASV